MRSFIAIVLFGCGMVSSSNAHATECATNVKEEKCYTVAEAIHNQICISISSVGHLSDLAVLPTVIPGIDISDPGTDTVHTYQVKPEGVTLSKTFRRARDGLCHG